MARVLIFVLMKRFITSCVVVMAVAGIPVAAYDGFDDNPSHRVGLNIDFTGDYYSLGLSYHRMVCPYLGFGGSIGYWTEVSSNGLLDDLIYDSPWDYDYDYGYGYGYGYDYYDYDDYDKDVAFFVEPSVILRTPALFSVGSCGFGLTAIGSVRFSTNYYCFSAYPDGNNWVDVEYKCRPISYGLNVSVAMRCSALELSLGYHITSLDVNRDYSSAYRFKREPLSGIFLEIAAYF